jgi:GNAT superfamily N-acetyltransferase
MLSAPHPLADQHQLADFDSGEPSLDDWLKRRAAKNQANGSSRTYVVCDGDTVIGYYCLAAGAIGHAEAPSSMKRNRPDPVPVLVLGRLAIHKDHRQKGIGTALLNEAIRRAIQAAEIAGVTALLVLEDMRMRKLEPRTQEAYVRAVRKLAVYLRRSPDTATVEDLRNFQLHLFDTGTSRVTCNATLAGLKFFFDITLGRGELMARMRPVKLPRTIAVVLSTKASSTACPPGTTRPRCHALLAEDGGVDPDRRAGSSRARLSSRRHS